MNINYNNNNNYNEIMIILVLGSDCVFDGGPTTETSFMNRNMSFSGTTAADGIITRERRSSSMSSNRSFRSMAANAARRHVTPSILQSVYPLSEDVEKINDSSAVSSKTG